MKQKLFTKSAFKIALECPRRLYYAYDSKLYANQDLTDDFLKSLADGGFQVGELAKVYYGVKGDADIDVLGYDEAVEKTKELFKNDTINIAEAAFRYGNLFVRADIIEKKKAYPLALNEPWYYCNTLAKNIGSRTATTLHDFWYGMGYTEEDYAIDSKGVEVGEVENEEFNVEVEYTLVGDNLKIKIPESKIYCPKDCKIQSLELHPNLLDFDSTYSGYYLLPDGSGSLVDLSVECPEEINLSLDVFGSDIALKDYKMGATLPLYAFASVCASLRIPLLNPTQTSSPQAIQFKQIFIGFFCTLSKYDAKTCPP
mgnify:CR=1 FL=1